MARDILSIPITTVSSKSFSIGGRILTKYRSCIHYENVQTLVATRNWLHDFSQTSNIFWVHLNIIVLNLVIL